MKFIGLAAAIVAIATPVRASSVIELGATELEAGSDRVVEATVVERSTSWNAAHTGLETRAVVAVTATLKGRSAARLEIVVPGGTLEGARHVVFGMPSLTVGERARWFLRDRGDATFRVYGWAQGKWPARTVDGVQRYAPAPLAAERATAAFTTNGMVWPAPTIPVPYLIQNAGSADVALPDVIAAIDAAFATWQAVPTSSLAFHNAGMTDLGLAVDGTNVVLFVESGWTFGSEAAAATSLFILDGQQTADIAVNGQNFKWAIAPPGSGIASHLLDLQAVLTHEIGHFGGLGHSDRSFDTMYVSWKPWQGQRTLSIDDKLGLSSIYPTSGDECAAGCPAEEVCNATVGLCEGVPDPIGAACNYDRVECDAFCLFTATNLSTGYCSRYCETNADCPLSHHCAAASAGAAAVKVCFVGAQPPPEPCVDSVCPSGEHCDAAGGCTFECRTTADCGPGTGCDDRGSCVADGPGGCSSGGAPGWLGACLAWFVVWSLRRRVIPRRAAPATTRPRSRP